MNSSVLGRLIRDAEVRTTSNGKTLLSFTVVWDRWNGKENVSQFIDCEMWGDRATKLVEYFKKGQQVYIAGQLMHSDYENKEGNKVRKYFLHVSDFTFGAKPSDSPSTNKSTPSKKVEIEEYITVDDDDVPF